MEKRNYQAELNAAYRQLRETDKEKDEKILKLRGGKVRKIAEINQKISHLKPHWWNNHAARILELETEMMNVKLDYETQINATYHFYEDRLLEIKERIVSIKQERFHGENQPKQPADGDTIDA